MIARAQTRGVASNESDTLGIGLIPFEVNTAQATLGFVLSVGYYYTVSSAGSSEACVSPVIRPKNSGRQRSAIESST